MPEPLQPGENSEGSHSPRPGAGADHTRAAAAGGSSEAQHPDWTDPADDSEAALNQLDPRWVTAERISGAIGAAVVTIGGFIALLIFGAGWRVFGFSAWAVLATVMFTGALLGPALQFRRARYGVTPFGIEIHWGILWRRVTIVPRSRIQHTDVEQGPLLRRFGLAKLVIHTAGTEHSTVPLYGLPMPRASAIRDDLMGRPTSASPAGIPPGAPRDITRESAAPNTGPDTAPDIAHEARPGTGDGI